MSHNIANCLNHYFAFRQAGNGANRQAFIHWLQNTHGYAPGGANAFWFPLANGQCGFEGLNLRDLDAITNDPEGFRASRILSATVPGHIQNACSTVKSAYAVAYYRLQGIGNQALMQDLVARGFAGTHNAAQAILTVGQAFLRHFALVDEADQANGRCALLFGP